MGIERHVYNNNVMVAQNVWFSFFFFKPIRLKTWLADLQNSRDCNPKHIKLYVLLALRTLIYSLDLFVARWKRLSRGES